MTRYIRQLTRRAYAAATAGAVAMSLLACSGSVSDTSTNTAATIPAIPTGTGMINSVKLTRFTYTPGTRVSAEGTVKSTATVPTTIVVSVSWVDSQTSTVFARGLTSLKDISPGEQRDWAIAVDLPKDAAHVKPVVGAVSPRE
ncbi:MAG: hypothetical protein J0I18_17890 [Actinobacteria bacterium]|nr:hypothetical protein [Actinomycetota bacterium]